MSREGRRRQGDRGAIAVLAALVIPLVMGTFLALSFNVGILMQTRTGLQAAVDSAALSGAKDINSTSAGLTAARAAAEAFAESHKVANSQVVRLDPDRDIEFGRWHFSAETCASGSGTCTGFEPMTPSTSNLFTINAIRAFGATDGVTGRNDRVPAAFSVFLGLGNGHSVSADGVAIGRGAMSACTLPYVIPQCLLVGSGGTIACGTTQTLRFGSDKADNAGTYDPHTGGNPDTNDLIALILGRCEEGVAHAGGGYPVGNGNNINSHVVNAMLGIQSNALVGTPPSGSPSPKCVLNTSQTFGIIEVPPSACAANDVKFTGTYPIARYAQLTILKITDQQGDAWCTCPTTPAAPKQNNPTTCPAETTSPKRTITVRIDCDTDGGLPGDATAPKLRLVR